MGLLYKSERSLEVETVPENLSDPLCLPYQYQTGFLLIVYPFPLLLGQTCKKQLNLKLESTD